MEKSENVPEGWKIGKCFKRMENYKFFQKVGIINKKSSRRVENKKSNRRMANYKLFLYNFQSDGMSSKR